MIKGARRLVSSFIRKRTACSTMLKAGLDAGEQCEKGGVSTAFLSFCSQMIRLLRICELPGFAVFFAHHVFLMALRLVVARFFVIVARVWHR